MTRLLAALVALCVAAAALPALAAEDRYFDSAGVKIRYVVEGEGEPVVLLHGYTNSIESGWVTRGVLPELAKNFRVIALDARGHGKSGKPHDRKDYGPEMGRDIIRLLDHLGIQRAHIVGYSMGAHIVAQLATTTPERFLTMTLGGAAGRRGWSADDQRRVDIESKEMDEGMLRSQILRLWPKDQPAPSDEEVRRRSEINLKGQDPRALAAVRRSNADQVVTDAQLAAIRLPILGIVGTADPYIKDFRELAALMPQLRVVTIEGASHGSAPGRPEFVRALIEFLAANRSRS